LSLKNTIKSTYRSFAQVNAAFQLQLYPFGAVLVHLFSELRRTIFMKGNVIIYMIYVKIWNSLKVFVPFKIQSFTDGDSLPLATVNKCEITAITDNKNKNSTKVFGTQTIVHT
jgi:hypothetical protein